MDPSFGNARRRAAHLEVPMHVGIRAASAALLVVCALGGGCTGGGNGDSCDSTADCIEPLLCVAEENSEHGTCQTTELELGAFDDLSGVEGPFDGPDPQ